MYCFQCEQTSEGTACTEQGVCGKDAQTAALQDLVVHALKGVSMYAHRARNLGASNPEIDRFVVAALFTTLTNVNFDIGRFDTLLQEIGAVKHDAAHRLAGSHRICKA
jgi:hydroxylamine reductase